MNSLQQGSHIAKGTQIEVTDALQRTFSKRALAEVDHHGRFDSVSACSEEEWAAAEREGREPEPEPFAWPVRSVRVAELA